MAQELELLLKAKNLSDEAFKAVEGHIKSLEKGSKKTESGFARARKGVNTFAREADKHLKTAVKTLGVLAGAAGLAATGIVLLADRGSEVATLRSSFESLAAGIDETADSMLGATREATKGLITDLDIMAASNKAMLLGLPVTTESMATMAKTATVLGRAMGQDATKSLDDLTTALGRSSPLILDNLGLTVKVGEANEAYARQLGKTASQLTDGEKKLAFYNAAMSAAEAKLAELGDIHLTFGDRVQQVRVHLQNFIDLLGEAITTSPVLNRALGLVAETMEKAFGGDQERAIQTIIELIESGTIALVEFAQAGLEATRLLHVGWLRVTETQATYMHDALRGLSMLKKLLGQNTDMVDAWANAEGRAAVAAIMSREKAGVAYKKVEGILVDFRRELMKAEKQGRRLAPVVAGGLDEVGDSAETAAAKVKKIWEFGAEALKLPKAVDLTATAFERLDTGIRGLPAAVDHTVAVFGDGVGKTTEQTVQWSEALEDVANQFQGLDGIAGEVLGRLAQGIAGIGASLDRIKASTATGLTGFFEKLAGGLGIFGGALSIGSTVGGLVGSLLGGDEEIRQVNDLRDEFFALQGGFEAFSRRMAQVSSEDWARKIFDARSVEDFNRLVEESKGLLGLQGQAHQELEAAVKKYGFSIEELGPKWRQQELDKMAGQLLKEYELLKGSGIDQALVLDKMGANLSEYVRTAVAAGQTVPEAMRPMIEAALANGEILDENGKAYASAEEAGITFAKTMSESMMEVVESVKELVAALTGIRPKPVKIPVQFKVPPLPRGLRGGEFPDFPGAARGAVVLPFRPREAASGAVIGSRPGGELVRMGEGGKAEVAAPVEALLARMQATAVQAAAAAGGTIVVENRLDGEKFGELIIRRNRAGLLPIREGSVRRRG